MPAVWSSVPTPVNNTVIDASWGTSVKAVTDLAGMYRKRFRCCRTSGLVGNTTNGTITDVVPVAVGTVIFDNDAMCASGYVYINTSGVWSLQLNAEWLPNATGRRTIEIYESTSPRSVVRATDNATTGGIATTQNIGITDYFDSNDMLQVRVAQSSGAGLGWSSGWYGLSLSGFLVSA